MLELVEHRAAEQQSSSPVWNVVTLEAEVRSSQLAAEKWE